ncbi:hypothetical protein EW026_g4064 [Hermanssonia centrifuga]|uniref:ABC transporter domain-containing protein n=1 Tax=Hermanssonia centrifuga TaxID=98765 RepID=A0A4S4KIB0_9APHY|nr:hypothetical protein EW026_g4064 [Hermanssonia centrifuga]
MNPTLQHVYPLASTLNILRTLNPSYTPLPNITGFGSNGTVYAQLFYAGVEQFYSDSVFCGSGSLNLAGILHTLSGTLEISCDAPSSNNTATCAFKQSVIAQVFGSSGLTLSGCAFGECVGQNIIDFVSSNSTATDTESGSHSNSLGGGVIAGLAVVGGLIAFALVVLLVGWRNQRRAKQQPFGNMNGTHGGSAIEWSNISYFVPSIQPGSGLSMRLKRRSTDQKVVLDNVSGVVEPGQMMAILGPSGAGKTTLIEILAGKSKTGRTMGAVMFPSSDATDTSIGFVPQQDILPSTLTVHEALLFAARLRLPEYIPDSEKLARVDDVVEKLGLTTVRDVRIGDGEKRGISGGEMRRVSIGLELVAKPQILILDEPTSGLDSVSAAKVAGVLHELAHDPKERRVVIATIHQPSSQLYHSFDQVALLSHGRTLYSGAGGFAPATRFSSLGIPYHEGYNVADYLLDVASDPPISLFQSEQPQRVRTSSPLNSNPNAKEISMINDHADVNTMEKGQGDGSYEESPSTRRGKLNSSCSTTFLTQLQVLSGREWKILRRDYTLFVTHVAVAAVLGVFVGGMYFKTGITIAGFQSRVGCLFFLGALIAFSTLSALYHVVETRPLFLRERSSYYYSPTAWLVTRFIFDVLPLRIIPTIIVAAITYWMAGLAHDAAHFFKFLFILVLYTLAMTLFNFLLACLFTNGGIAILLSALTALYQMTYAGFFVHLNDIPPVLRWLQWLCPLKYTLEALSVNEVGSGLMIQDTLQGVPVDVSASLIMNLLFGFGSNNYYRDVLALFAFIAGFGLGVIGVVWFKVRERR